MESELVLILEKQEIYWFMIKIKHIIHKDGL